MRRRLFASAALACALVASATASHASAAVTDPPEQWDQRIDELVRFVEAERRLDFEHPVPVRFLSEAEFRKEVRDWDGEITPDDRELAALEASDLLALGLATELVDVLGLEGASNEDGIVGFYDDETREMVVRGTDLDDVDVRLTIVHELTHALQDQHFSLHELDERAGGPGLDALVEGDAELVTVAYLDSLPEADQDEYYENAPDAGALAGPDGGAGGPGVTSPLALELWGRYPYDFGYAFLEVAVAAHGHRALDALFRDPPDSEEQVIDPVALEVDDRPLRVELPKFAAPDRPQGPADTYGAFSWYLLLASRIPWQDALTAVEGWGGDRYRSFTRVDAGEHSACVRLSVTGDTGRDSDELDEAIRSWAAALADGTSVTREGRVVNVDACVTDDAPPSGDDAMQAAYDRLWERTDQMWYLTTREIPPDDYARCVADHVVADPDAQPLLYADDEPTRRERGIVDDAYDEAYDACD
jgi:hypothetical protein